MCACVCVWIWTCTLKLTLETYHITIYKLMCIYLKFKGNIKDNGEKSMKKKLKLVLRKFVVMCVWTGMMLTHSMIKQESCVSNSDHLVLIPGLAEGNSKVQMLSNRCNKTLKFLTLTIYQKRTNALI